MNKLTGYLGTYASPESLGIYRFSLDLKDGSLSRPELYYNAPDCKYLSLDGTMLAAPEKIGGLAGVCLLDISAKEPVLIGEAFHETAPACYVHRIVDTCTLPITTKALFWYMTDLPRGSSWQSVSILHPKPAVTRFSSMTIICWFPVCYLTQ